VSLLTLFALYWGIWVVHFLDGQVILPMLAVYLSFLSRPRLDASARALVPVVMSAKVFTLFALLPIWRRLISKRAVYGTLFLALALTWGTARLSYDGELGATMRQWTVAATSGAQHLNPGQTRGSKNQS